MATMPKASPKLCPVTLRARLEASEQELHECRVVGYVRGYMAREPVHEWFARRLAYLEPRSERAEKAERLLRDIVEAHDAMTAMDATRFPEDAQRKADARYTAAIDAARAVTRG
jgi:hypothetical protein